MGESDLNSTKYTNKFYSLFIKNKKKRLKNSPTAIRRS